MKLCLELKYGYKIQKTGGENRQLISKAGRNGRKNS